MMFQSCKMSVMYFENRLQHYITYQGEIALCLRMRKYAQKCVKIENVNYYTFLLIFLLCDFLWLPIDEGLKI